MIELVLLFQVCAPTNNPKIIFEFLSKLVYYSYFKIDDNHYIFTYAKSQFLKNSIINIITSNFTILRRIRAYERPFRSFRGFCMFILGLKETGNNFQVLETNLKQEFWEELGPIIRQKNKSKLEQYLFNFNEKEFNTESFILKNFEQPINKEFEVSNGRIIFHLNFNNK